MVWPQIKNWMGYLGHWHAINQLPSVLIPRGGGAVPDRNGAGHLHF